MSALLKRSGAIIELSSLNLYGVVVKCLRKKFLTADTAGGRRAVFESMEARFLLAGGTIQGVVWNDLDGDGASESNEPRLAGWTLYLDANHNSKLDASEVSTLSGFDGGYAFQKLAAGNYLIGAVPNPGWNQTFPSMAFGPPAGTAPVDASSSDAIGAATARSANTNRYDSATLDAATGWVVGIGRSTTVRSVLSRSGAASATASGLLPNTYILTFPKGIAGSRAAAQLARTPGLSFYYPLVGVQQKSRFVPNDPLFSQEWHLQNTGQFGGLVGADTHVTPVWDQYQGAGVTIGIVDDGVQYTHPDLKDNYDAIDSFDFNGNDSNPAPDLTLDTHGTEVAGVAAARGNNGIGVSGAAPQARFAAIRLTDAEATDQQEAGALSYHRDAIDIYSNSWGPDDDGVTLQGPGPMTLASFKDSVANGRNGKGSVYVWASGNGLQSGDNVNYDGYANSRYVIAATAVDDSGKQAYYAEPGAPILVSAYGGGRSPGIITTDLLGSSGEDPTDYFNNFGGTSASAPLVSGVVALMLQANPNLGWRDVKQILVNTARKNDPADPGWMLNGGGHWVNHKYGFGTVDAAAAVNAALTWKNLVPETVASSGTVLVGRAIPDNDATGVNSSTVIDRLMRVETVEVVFDATHPARGDLRVVLTSPDGTRSVLAERHDDTHANYSQWTFTSTHHWDEIAKGTWTLTVTDEAGRDVGTWSSWKLNVYGTPVGNEQYVSLALGATVMGRNFGFRPFPGARIASFGFPFQTGQRLVFTFDREVNPNIPDSALEVINDTTGQALPPQSVHLKYTATARIAVWSFSGLNKGLLPDGNYTVRLKASQITLANGAMLDGNGDGAGGDDYVAQFFQLNGDANRDRTVNTADFKILLENLYRPDANWSRADFNYDGTVDFADFQALELSFGHSLSAPVTMPKYGGAIAGSQALAPAVGVAVGRPPVAPRPMFSVLPIRRRRMDLLDDFEVSGR